MLQTNCDPAPSLLAAVVAGIELSEDGQGHPAVVALEQRDLMIDPHAPSAPAALEEQAPTRRRNTPDPLLEGIELRGAGNTPIARRLGGARG